MKIKPIVIDPNKIKVRDELLKQLILGTTKSGTHIDKKKEQNKKSCRNKKVDHDQEQ